jgi:hypothetical protein
MENHNDPRQQFERGAVSEQSSFLGELFLFMRYNKKFWLTPILIVLLAMSVLILLGGTAAAPFIYTLF